MLKRLGFLILIGVLFAFSVSAEVTFNGTIPDLTLKVGMNRDVVDLSKYFNQSNGSSLEYKYKAGDDGVEGLVIEIDTGGEVDIEVSSAASRSVIFLADDDVDVAESNDVKIIVSGGGVGSGVSFSPNTGTVELKEGEKQVFAVSGNQSVKWYLDSVMLNHTEGNYEFKEEEVKVYKVKAVVGQETKIWTVSVLAKAVVEPPAEPEEPEVKEPECGNGVREAGENCGNCPSDVRCSGNARCKDSACVPVANYSRFILWIVLLAAVVVFVVAGVILMRKKFSKRGDVSTQFKKQVGGTGKVSILDKIKNIFKKKEEKVQGVQKFQKQQQVQKPLGKVQKPLIEAEIKPLIMYFKSNLAKYKIRDLVSQALKQGWRRDQVDKVLAKIGKGKGKGKKGNEKAR